MRVHFTIPGVPVPKARPRVKKNGFTYTPKKTEDYEALVKDVYNLTAKHYFSDSPLHVYMDLFFPIPKSYSKKRRKELSCPNTPYPKRPDADNVIKAITDALNGIAYKDDGQIVRVSAAKWYGKEPRAEVVIEEV